MFTIILTLFGLIVFIISLVTAGFKTGFKRFLMFIITGVVLDVTMALLGLGVLFSII